MAKRKKAMAALAALFMGAAAPVPAEAAQGAVMDFPACSDDAGNSAVYMTKDQYREKVRGLSYPLMHANARYLNGDLPATPVIVYNPAFIESLSAMTRTFVFLHECHHLSSGDARNAYLAFGGDTGRADKDAMEYNANCAAVKRLRYEFGATAEDIAAMESVIRSVNKKKADERMKAIMACYSMR